MSLLFEGAAGFIESFFGRFHYSGPFVVLLLCGIGLPLPEEVTLIGSGVLVYQGDVDFVPMVVVCSIAILMGDSIPYWVGRRYGMSVVNHRWVSRLVRPGRIRLLERQMKEHGNWVIFTCRFMPGIRIPGYFTAGLLGMRFSRFIILDALGVLISVPISIYLGAWFGESIDQGMKGFHLLLGLAVLSLVLIMLVRSRFRIRLRQERISTASAAHEGAAEGLDSLLSQEGGFSAGATEGSRGAPDGFPSTDGPAPAPENDEDQSKERSSTD